MTDLHVVVPAGIDDPERPSGGNTYDRRLIDGLVALGWHVQGHEVAGSWPQPDTFALSGLADVVAQVPTGALLLVDGLVASCSDTVLVNEAERLRIVVLVHMPLGPDAREAAPGERRVLRAASAVITTSGSARRLLLDTYGLHPDTVHVAQPGVDAAPLSPGTPAGGELLCVAALTPHKGHADLVAALALVADLQWRCLWVGSLQLDPVHVADLRGRLSEHGLADRVRLTGPLSGPALAEAYAAVDLLVLPSHAETFGMVVSEALARGVPVLATSVGGVPEALGQSSDGLPGLLVAPADHQALAAALRSWLCDEPLRTALRRRAAERRLTLTRWSGTVEMVADVLAGAGPAEPREQE